MSNSRRQITPGERTWRAVFFLASAAMAAFALLDLEAGRWAGALGDLGVTLLLLSLLPQFPLVRAIVAATEKPRSREEMVRQVERARPRVPWAEHAGAGGWVLLGASILLRLLGFE
ncbi:MAG: hypothetical protein RMK97_05530 [Sutterellaceae bacterium]|nr:hypothetical protein [Burkholderiaceae bacterium]MCX7901376.1 hypothetical protein [Burkholderiaceae bacterium]MDW8429953.1 hypothetical protein [Sutterellaceae bacterium]